MRRGAPSPWRWSAQRPLSPDAEIAGVRLGRQAKVRLPTRGRHPAAARPARPSGAPLRPSPRQGREMRGVGRDIWNPIEPWRSAGRRTGRGAGRRRRAAARWSVGGTCQETRKATLTGHGRRRGCEAGAVCLAGGCSARLGRVGGVPRQQIAQGREFRGRRARWLRRRPRRPEGCRATGAGSRVRPRGRGRPRCRAPAVRARRLRAARPRADPVRRGRRGYPGPRGRRAPPPSGLRA